MKKLLSVLFLLSFTLASVYAQNIQVKGTVVSGSDNEPLPGVNVVVKGTTNGGITDLDGNFTLSVPADATLSITYIGFKSQEVAVNGKNSLKIVLQEDSETLDEVVVVGYGVQKKSVVTASIAKVSSEDLENKSPVRVDGKLNINCFKGSDGKIYSGRVYAKVNTGWEYGYFEARIMLPEGKGTWPAFWMMPVGNDWNTNPWPMCGEIDIMEEVGVVPNEVSSSIHTQDYNHTIGTQKTHAMTIEQAEGEFHLYALEWTEDAITTYVDGKVQLAVTKQQLGAGHNQWPFHYAFYPILNLAWGGDWGGMNGVDESALPVTMKVDYVRVFQKK